MPHINWRRGETHRDRRVRTLHGWYSHAKGYVFEKRAASRDFRGQERAALIRDLREFERWRDCPDGQRPAMGGERAALYPRFRRDILWHWL